MNIVPLPVQNLNNVPALARQLADDIEAGEYGNVSRVIVVRDADDLHTFGWGDIGDAYAGVGLLDAAKFTMIASLFDGE